MSKDIGTTQRKAMTPQRRLRVFEKHRGLCCICHLRIDGTREKWIVEHVRALELGGEDHDDNCAPAHEACGREKTRTDHAMAAHAKRVKIRHLGIAQSRSPLPHGRNSPTKRKMDGSVVPRRPK